MKAFAIFAVLAGFFSFNSLALAEWGNCPQGQAWDRTQNACVSSSGNFNTSTGTGNEPLTNSGRFAPATGTSMDTATRAGANASLNGGNSSVGVGGDSNTAISAGGTSASSASGR